MPNTRQIQDWLITRIAELLQIDPGKINIRESFSNYGLSSFDAVTLSGDMEEFIGSRLSPTITYDYPDIFSLSEYLAANSDNRDAPLSVNMLPGYSEEPIAVIGMSCRFPGASNPESFWKLLHDGIDMISEVPPDRWPKQAFYNADSSVPGKSISYWGGFLDNVDQFDPFFFGISPIEAKQMDPQQRLLLELSYEALDDAGQIKENIDGSDTGVFIGISVNEYSQLQLSDPLQINSHSGTGSALSIAANRISYFFNFHGPSIAIDSACSSSLAGVHLACQSIRNGECNMALAGGVNIILSPANSIAFTKAGVLAPDGRCKTFDAQANGYVRGEGGGLVILKKLTSALADGDPINALILGSAMRQDGRTNGLIAPSGEGQENLLREAYRSAGISPGSIQYIEAHGTGTLLGDSMEVQALGAVVGAASKNRPCSIGSVKTNIGHLEAAAGIAGLIKVILSIKHRILPPSLHYHSPNPHIPFYELNLKVNSELNTWPIDSSPALAGVSSFGFGGTNVHVVVSEATKVKLANENNDPINSTISKCYLLPLSGKSPEALKSIAGDFLEFLVPDSSIILNDLCHAASLRRSQFDYRLVIIGNSRKELHDGLSAFLMGESVPNLFISSEIKNRQPKLVFVFSGQGGQWYGMCRELLKQEPVFYNAIKRIDLLIQKDYDWSLMNELCAERSESRLDEIDVVQPAIFAIQVALAEQLKSWGITPDSVAGHSLGEVAAAHIAGILSLEDAIRIICGRSKLLQKLRGKGSMLATELSVDQAKEIIKRFNNHIAIAVINSPFSTILSGDPESINEVMDSLQRQNLFCKLVNVDVASHSPQIDQLRSQLLDVLTGLKPQHPCTPVYSTVTGDLANDISFDADYWVDNLRKPVLFSDATKQLLDDGHSIFVEVGPHPLLLGSIQQSLKPHHQNVSLFTLLRREEPEREVMLKTLAALYTNGFTIAWKNLYPTSGKYVQLPPIPWQRQRFWIDTKSATLKDPWHLALPEDKKFHPLLGGRLNLANSSSSFVWQTTFENEIPGFLEDHCIDNEIIFPAAGYIEMALQSAKEADLNNSHELSDFVFKERMILQKGNLRIIQTQLIPDKEDSFSFSVYSQINREENWILYASANFIKQKNTVNDSVVTMINPKDVIHRQGNSHFTPDEFYQALQTRGIQYGKSFRTVQHIWSKADEALGQISIPDALHDKDFYQIHPALLDGCFQVIAAIQSYLFEHNLYIPIACNHIRYYSRPKGLIWSYVSLRSDPALGSDVLSVDILLSDDNDNPIAEFKDFRLQRTTRSIRHLLSQDDTWLYHLQWQVREAPANSPGILHDGKQWLIFADDEGLGEELAKQLERKGDHCHLLSYKTIIKNRELEPKETLLETIEKLINVLSSPLYGIIHLWSFSTAPATSGIFENQAEISTVSCNSILFLLQTLSKRLAGTPRLWLVTRGAQPVKSGEAVAVEQSTLGGLGKVISFEIPELKCSRIDLDPLQSNTASVQLLLKQIYIDDSEDQIAFREGIRFVPRLLPFTISNSSPAVLFRADSTYIITGGLGGLGLKMAMWMASRGAKHLVLLGRNEPSALATAMLDQIRKEGVDVVIARADVSDNAQLRKVFDNIEKNMPVLRGVIHAAGVLDDASLLNLNAERMKKVMAPKVDGTWNLHNATIKIPLDFFVLFSSAVSVLGSPGQGNYAAGSAYLDAMAFHRRNLGLPAISINWGPWAEVGLAAKATERLNEQNASTQHLIKVIKIEQGLEILGQLLKTATPQVMVLPFDLKNLIELYPVAAGMPFLSEVGGSDTHVARLYARPKLRQQYVAPENEIECKLAELWRQTLHIDNVGIHDSFFELGGDSVLAAQILALAQKTFGISINPQEAFKAFTIERLAEMLETEIMNKIEGMSEEEVQQQLLK
ncbi:MAG: SDR family NAD(P)-dependent oxidoreductase [Bacteroidota bacterium]